MKITIDPGVGGTGWALWNAKWGLLKNGVIHEAYGGQETDDLIIWKHRAIKVSERVREMCWKGVDELYIEYPSVFGGGVAAQSGAVVKLACLVGMICGSAGVNYFELVPVHAWKGNLPKDVVQRRIKKLLPNAKAESHDWDAIGIGLYKKGVF